MSENNESNTDDKNSQKSSENGDNGNSTMQSPIQSPIASPIESPSRMQSPMESPMNSPMQSPINSPMQSPVYSQSPINSPMMEMPPQMAAPPQMAPPAPYDQFNGQQQGYPGYQGYQQGYPGYQGGYQGGYPPMGYPPQQGGYPQQGYPPMGYPPQQAGYPPMQQQMAPPSQQQQYYNPQQLYNSGYQAPYGQFPPPAAMDQYPPPAGQPSYNQPPPAQYNNQAAPSFNPDFSANYHGAPYAAPPAAAAEEEEIEAELTEFFNPTDEQVADLQTRLRNRFRHTMPFDWIGQADYEWYSSWILNQRNFVAFRIVLALYAYWAWCKFWANFDDSSWSTAMEAMMDPSSIVRFWFPWLALLSVFVGFAGMAIISLLQLVLSPATFKALVAYKKHKSFSGKWLSWAIYGINYHYDAAPVTACMPLVLSVAPAGFFEFKLAQDIWPALTLPLLAVMDLWMSKRCRIDATYIRRNLMLALAAVTFYGLSNCLVYHWVIRTIFAIYTTKSFMGEIAPTLLLAWSFAIVSTVGTDLVYHLNRFKTAYLLKNHYDKLAVRDIKDIVKENDAYYTGKRERIMAEMAEAQAKAEAEMAAYYAAMEAQYGADYNGGMLYDPTVVVNNEVNEEKK